MAPSLAAGVGRVRGDDGVVVGVAGVNAGALLAILFVVVLVIMLLFVLPDLAAMDPSRGIAP